MKYTILINKQNKLKDSFINKLELIEIDNVAGERIQIEKETYNAFLELQNYLQQKNIHIGIVSAYKKRTEEESDYNTALAIHICIQGVDPYDEIHSVLKDFGFILRYPKGKEMITGNSYEPWHIRYVGKFPASIMAKENLTLEEYLENFGCILCINKPKGITSFDVVNEISHLFGIKRVGHTGTLDPLATGVMLVAVGTATKIVELLTAEDKEYIASAELGYQTDTYDNTGTIIKTKEVPKNISLKETLTHFQKTYLQEVPIYSAIKVQGKKLYDYARNGEKVEIPKREVTIKKLELLEEKDNAFTIKTLVTKGCYIRSLINDIGLSLNTYATMTSLIRTKQGKVNIEQACTLEDLKTDNFQYFKIEEVLDYPMIEVEKEEEKQIHNGVKLPNNWSISDKVLFKNKEGKLLGIYEVFENQLKVWKNFQ